MPKVHPAQASNPPGGLAKPSTTRPNAAQRKSIFSTTRFTAAANSRISAATHRLTAATKNITKEKLTTGPLPAMVFVTSVSVGLVVIGIALIYIGLEEYIVDLMVLGGLLLGMGLIFLLVGALVVLTPVYKDRLRQKVDQRENKDMTFADSCYLHPDMVQDEDAVLRPAPGTSAASPGASLLYQDGLESVPRDPESKGTLLMPPPPLLYQPLENEAGITSSVLTPQRTRDRSGRDSGTYSDQDLDIFKDVIHEEEESSKINNATARIVV